MKNATSNQLNYTTLLKQVFIILGLLALTACGGGGGGSDSAAPVITLNGMNPISLEAGGVYTEPGASANDEVDGDISDQIVIDSSQLDTTTVGDYSVTYNVSDAAGNAATEVTRTVSVVAGAAPTGSIIFPTTGLTEGENVIVR